ncbi:hybrid sensor histidine kinase/response regulator transcription factor [Chitinophaga qingshengii]|uniref:histidine kinase n=1 Tax=Chitinophaga qingshengii TaxID=1569794 RepID=A0ABR7TQA1_9BACT|nr:hybrid sensor histidine kinase/response regulator transcription factor [Chitinophaga qingshengii]MBC9931810.1 response regulator [Chitinophaga qingshengii]
MILRCFLLLCLLIPAAFIPGSGQDITFSHLTVEDGLSHNAGLSIVQDEQGFVWVGTHYGLNRYDGYRFKIYRHHAEDSTSLPDNQIMTLYRDKSNTLWIGTTGGLARYDPVHDRFNYEQLEPAPNRTNINCIYEDSKGRHWVGANNGLFVREGKKWQLITPGKIAGYVVKCVYEDKQGNIWIGTNKGLTKMTGDRFETFRHEDGQPSGLTMNFITALNEDRFGRLWIATQTGGINIYDPAAGRFSLLAQPAIINNIVRRIVRDKAGNMWVGTQEGLSIVDPVNLSSRHYQQEPHNNNSLSQNSIHSIYEDNSGTMWIGTYFGGVNIVHPDGSSFKAWAQHPPLDGISNNVISSIHEDSRHNYWIGTEGGGLNYYDRNTARFTYYKHDVNNPASLGSNLVKVVYEDKDHNIWTGTHGGGLNLLENGGFRRFFYNPKDPATFSGEVTSILEDSQNRFWVGTNVQLYLMHRKGRELEQQADTALMGIAKRQSVRYILEDSRRRILVGTINGLYVLTGDSVQVLQRGYINAIQEDSKHNIWVSLYFGGLVKYDTRLQLQKHYREKDGLPNDNVLGLLEDDQHYLWISTHNGLTRLDPARDKFQTYTVSDGLAGNVFNYNSFLRDSRGEFLFGGYNGITSFFPERIITNTHAAPIRFTGLRLFNNPVGISGQDQLLAKDISYTKTLHFQHNQDVFTLEFALLNYIKSNKNRYAYRLEGGDGSWIETTTPAVTYTNLSSGHYTFWVKGANNDGIWSEPAKMEITILPPFWRTWWAYAIYGGCVILLVFFVTRFFFLWALLHKEEELHQVKLNFFTHVSHEIRTHLTLLLVPVEKMMDNLKKDDPLQATLSQLRNNADRLLKLVNELMDFRKAETNHLTLHVHEQDLIPFLERIYSSFRELSLDRNIRISFSHDVEQVELYFDREQLEKVFFNLLTNAFKFTPDGGHIQLHVSPVRQNIVITVTDNGRGIAPEYLDKLFNNFFQVQDHGLQNTGYGIGLALSKNIVEQHKGTLTVESEPSTADKEGRTCFTVSLPTGARHFEGTPHTVGGEPARSGNSLKMPLVNEEPDIVISDKPQPFTILIVEDNPELRALIRETFQGHYKVLECENGAAGLTVATTQIPDIIVSDVMMPEMDGLQFCQALKTDERTSHIPVVLLTAKSSQADHVSGLETGADLYLTKPFSTRVLALNVRNLILSREKMRERYSRQLQTETVVPDPLPNSLDNAFLEKVIALVEEHMDDPAFGVEMLARKVAMSQPVLYKKLKAVTDMSVNDFVKSLRLKKAAALIRTRQHTVYQVAYMVGYNDRKYFSREFKKQFGKTPTEFAETPDL